MESTENLEWEFFLLKREIFNHFEQLPLNLQIVPDKKSAEIALTIGKFLVWTGGKIDDYVTKLEAVCPALIPGEPKGTVTELGREIQRASIQAMEGKSPDNRIIAELLTLNSRLEKLEGRAA